MGLSVPQGRTPFPFHGLQGHFDCPGIARGAAWHRGSELEQRGASRPRVGRSPPPTDLQPPSVPLQRLRDGRAAQHGPAVPSLPGCPGPGGPPSPAGDNRCARGRRGSGGAGRLVPRVPPPAGAHAARGGGRGRERGPGRPRERAPEPAEPLRGPRRHERPAPRTQSPVMGSCVSRGEGAAGRAGLGVVLQILGSVASAQGKWGGGPVMGRGASSPCCDPPSVLHPIAKVPPGTGCPEGDRAGRMGAGRQRGGHCNPSPWRPHPARELAGPSRASLPPQPCLVPWKCFFGGDSPSHTAPKQAILA